MNVGATSLTVMMSRSQGLPGDGAYENPARAEASPQTAARKPFHWAKLSARTRSWLQLGSASLIGWLIMASISSL
jgi:hypothetical protein